MARGKVEISLDDLIIGYAENNTALKALKTQVDKDNTLIKSIMAKEKLQYKEAGDWKASYSVQHKDTMNENRLIHLFKDHGMLEFIMCREAINWDALESAMYKNKFSKELLLEIDACRETKDVEVLRVTKKKEDK